VSPAPGDGAEDGRRVGAQGDGDGKRFVRVRLPMLAKIQRAAAMRQPAHDHLVRGDHLLAVDAEVLALLVRAAGDGQPPGDQRRHVARPAVLDRQAAQIDVGASHTISWHGALFTSFGAMS